MTNFDVTRGLRNPHIQGIVSRLPARKRHVMQQSMRLRELARPLLLHGGDAQLLAWHSPAQNGDSSAPLALLLHGWEGSSDSLYLLSTAACLHALGFQILRLNLRDHGASHHLNRELFHSCRDGEVAAAIDDALTRLTPRAAALVGFSLGGNFCLRVGTLLAATRPVKQIIAVCPVLDPSKTLQALEQGPWFYRQYFLRKWRESLQRKANVHPDLQPRLHWQGQNTLTDMTDHFVRSHTDFHDLQAYLAGYAITGNRLQRLRFPAHVILADDDPVIPVEDWQHVAPSALLHCERTRYGGHCGFITDWSFNGWIEQRIAEVLRVTLAEVLNTQATIDASRDRNQKQ